VLNKAVLRWNRTSKTVCALVAIAIYFALAEWSKRTYVEQTPAGKIVVRLNRPFEKYGTRAVVCYQLRSIETLEEFADSDDNSRRSPVLLYENDRLLGPAHSSHPDIANLGEGRYSHFKGVGFLFSASDKTDPNINGRQYWAVVAY
jgi:hypothetical protein